MPGPWGNECSLRQPKRHSARRKSAEEQRQKGREEPPGPLASKEPRSLRRSIPTSWGVVGSVSANLGQLWVGGKGLVVAWGAEEGKGESRWEGSRRQNRDYLLSPMSARSTCSWRRWTRWETGPLRSEARAGRSPPRPHSWDPSLACASSWDTCKESLGPWVLG